LTHAFAAFGARGADLRADATDLHVEVRLPEHEIHATAAAFGAIDKKLDVVGGCVLSALLQTIGKGLSTGLVTLGAIRDALLHLARGQVHDVTPSLVVIEA
jgi:hypothetical protein